MAGEGEAGAGAGSGAEGNAGATAVYDAPFDVAAHVPEPLRTEPYFQSFKGKTLGEVIKSGVEAHKAVGGSVRIPTAEAKPEEWDAFYTKLRPESADKYDVNFKDERVKKELSSQIDTFKKVFHQAGLTQAQVKIIMDGYEDVTAGDFKTLDQEVQTGVVKGTEELKKQHGANFDVASVMANRVARRFGGDKFVQLIKDYHLEADPTFFNTFHAIGQAVHEDTWLSGDTAVKMLTKEGAKVRVDEILSNPRHPYHNAGDPNHGAASAEVRQLRKIMYRKDEE